MRRDKKLIIILIVGILIGFLIGFSFGVKAGLDECVEYGVHIAKNFIDIDFDEEKMTNLLLKYKTKIEYEGGII